MIEILYFTAAWCGPCKAMKPRIAEWKEQDNVNIKEINIDMESGMSEQFQVRGIPCFVFVKDGVEVSRVVGAQPVHLLKERLARLESNS